jgi:eukaryotic-like serine/threonine-protein kinase
MADNGNTFGPYRLHELLNTGGMAEIWHVTDAEGRPFALRRMLPALRYNFLAKRRFLRGCQILSEIHNHEYVVTYVKHGKIEGQPYLLMEYVECSNLKEVCNRGDDLLSQYLGNILIDMATALEHVHESGYMHLDFKPENVLVTRNGNIRLVDFDLARPKPLHPKKYWGNPGTPAYMAPEQLMKRPIDHRADIWAFGVTAYEVVTNRKPFPGETGKEVLRGQLERSATFVAPREINGDLPIALERTILKCLEHNPDDRYPFLSVLVRDLEAALYVSGA